MNKFGVLYESIKPALIISTIPAFNLLTCSKASHQKQFRRMLLRAARAYLRFTAVGAKRTSTGRSAPSRSGTKLTQAMLVFAKCQRCGCLSGACLLTAFYGTQKRAETTALVGNIRSVGTYRKRSLRFSTATRGLSANGSRESCSSAHSRYIILLLFFKSGIRYSSNMRYLPCSSQAPCPHFSDHIPALL